jgi:hypothetical protein
MPQPADQYEPIVDDDLAIPLNWTAAPVMSAVLATECACPTDCLHDHENE